MAKTTLTDRKVQSLKAAPKGKRYQVMDTLVPGFGVRVTDKAVKTYIFQARFPGSVNPARREIDKATVGEPRTAAADIFQHVHTRVVELVAGSVAEALFLHGEPWHAADDRCQEKAYASLICSSPESIEAFVNFCMVEAAALLRPREHIVRALTAEHARRAAWRRAEESAASFVAVQAP